MSSKALFCPKIVQKPVWKLASGIGYSARRRGDQVNFAVESCKTMTGTTELLVKDVIKKMAPAIRKHRFPTVSIPQKNDKGEFGAGSAIRGDDIGSCVAYKKPQLPPLLGPIVFLYLLEMYSKDGEDK